MYEVKVVDAKRAAMLRKEALEMIERLIETPSELQKCFPEKIEPNPQKP